MKSEGEGSKEEVFLIITHSWESLYSSIWYEYQFSLWLYTQFFHFSTNSVFSAKLKTIICTFITYWGPAMLSTLSGTRYSAANTKRAWFLNLSYERKHNNQIRHEEKDQMVRKSPAEVAWLPLILLVSGVQGKCGEKSRGASCFSFWNLEQEKECYTQGNKRI